VQNGVLIIPDGQLSNLPWSAFIHQGHPLAADHGLVLSPSLQHYLHARSTAVPADAPVGVFVGGKSNLAPVREELAALLQGADPVEMRDPCRRGDWPAVGEWAMWHFTGHARYRADNPFYSSLSLEDGPLFGADFRLKNCRVGLVTLAACRTAHQSVQPGEEATGLVRCLLEMGSRNVVGSHWAVSDHSVVVWMNHYYKAILAGRTVREAVREASLTTREEYPSVYDWASFSVYGAG